MKGRRPAGNRRVAAVRVASWVAIGVGLLLIALRVPVAAMVASLEGSVRDLGAWGPLVFGGIYVLAVVALVPASALTLAAGAIFGPVAGTVITSLASTAGAAAAFLISRYVARHTVQNALRADPRFAAIDRAISEGGWKVVALLRLSPAFPFSLQNYAYGVTSLRFGPTILTSWIAMLPGTLLYVSLGYAGRAGAEAASGGHTMNLVRGGFWAVGLAATIAATVLLTRHARKVLAEQSPSLTMPEPPDNPDRWTHRTTGLVLLAMVVLGAGISMQWVFS